MCDAISPVNFTFYDKLLKSIACMALAREGAEEIKSRFIFKFLGIMKINATYSNY
jgi:hypothetical protein